LFAISWISIKIAVGSEEKELQVSISNKKNYNPKTFQVGELFKAFSETEDTLGKGVVFKRLSLQERIVDGALLTYVYEDLLPLEKLCDFSRSTICIYCTDSHGGGLDISISTIGESLVVDGSGDSATSLSDAFMLLERRLGLIPYTRPKSISDDQSPRLSLDSLNNRLQVFDLVAAYGCGFYKK
jgi:hypothetical protein